MFVDCTSQISDEILNSEEESQLFQRFSILIAHSVSWTPSADNIDMLKLGSRSRDPVKVAFQTYH